MNEGELPIHFADTAQAAMDASKSAGQMLREAREAHGLHVAALAVSLKVPVKKLEALEADRLQDLPDAVFIRALAASVCRALKIDAKPILAKLPQLNTRVLDQTGSGVNVAFRTRADGPAPSALASINRPMLFGVLGILLAAIILILLPDLTKRTAAQAGANASLSTESSAGASNASSTGASNAGVTLGSPVNVASTPVGSASDATTAMVSPSADTATPMLSVTPALSTPSVSSPTLTISSPAANAGSVPVPADSVIVFTATGETWIQVKDAGGRVILQRTLQNGDKTGAGPAQGKLPYSVTVGRANLTQVAVRGQAFDLELVSSKDAVARFSVK